MSRVSPSFFNARAGPDSAGFGAGAAAGAGVAGDGDGDVAAGVGDAAAAAPAGPARGARRGRVAAVVGGLAAMPDSHRRRGNAAACAISRRCGAAVCQARWMSRRRNLQYPPLTWRYRRRRRRDDNRGALQFSVLFSPKPRPLLEAPAPRHATYRSFPRLPADCSWHQRRVCLAVGPERRAPAAQHAGATRLALIGLAAAKAKAPRAPTMWVEPLARQLLRQAGPA